jgi:hypothetical protein
LTLNFQKFNVRLSCEVKSRQIDTPSDQILKSSFDLAGFKREL